MIAQDGKDLNIMLCQFMKETHIIQLRCQIMTGTGIYVTGNQHGIHFPFNGDLDDLLEGPDRGLADNALPAFIYHSDIVKGTAQMQVTTMYKT